ncbi:Vitellogenin 2 [Caligus rogercresseyi]|uniref:Vitellogenin 2 n=1 Tax=Caligus rogercresseyi TaxID=217165 RepID=A0A7T8KGU8_CALRO|nr:Vitellogenin 2 [Caligus rogercresseyi]
MELNCNAQTPTIKIDALPMVSANYHFHVGTYSPFTQEAIVTGLKQDLTINIPTSTHLKYQSAPTNSSLSSSPFK